MTMCNGKMDPATGLIKVAGTYDRNNHGCCIWNDLFSNNDSESLFEELTFVGFVSLAFLSWLSYKKDSLALKKHLNEDTYRLLPQFIVAMQLRVFVPMLITMVNQVARGWFISCAFSAALETFFVVFEIECFTHICIERFVVAKYVKNGWPIQKKHYQWFTEICYFFAAFYSLVPFAIGAYGLDFNCTSCTLDMVLPDGLNKYIIGSIHFMKSLKPLAFLNGMLFAAKYYEAYFDDEMKNRGQSFYTDIILRVSTYTTLFWIPIGAVRGYILHQQMRSQEIFAPPASYIRVAFILYQFSPAVTTMALLFEDRKLQKKPLVISESIQERKGE